MPIQFVITYYKRTLGIRNQVLNILATTLYLRADGREKRSKQGSSSSIEEEGTSRPDNLQLLKDSINCLKKVVSEGFAKLHEDMEKLLHEFKEDFYVVKGTIKDIEESLRSTQEDVESRLKEVVNSPAQLSNLITP